VKMAVTWERFRYVRSERVASQPGMPPQGCFKWIGYLAPIWTGREPRALWFLNLHLAVG